ncbi:MAG TPA: ATP-binding protein [Myxococcota bacterium]|nr:ATP-binding protein [Myxococcota bacterium]
MSTPIELQALLKRLHLATVLRKHADFEAQAAAEQWTHHEFLTRLLAEEVANRAGTRITRKSHQAHFPYLKTIEEFDFTFQSSIRRQQLGPFLGPSS